MFGFQRKSLFRKGERGIGIALDQLLFQQATDADKAGGLGRQKRLVGFGCAFAIACGLGGLGDQQRRQFRAFQIFLGALGADQREAAFAGSQRKQAFGQRLIALAFAVAVEIA
ncbi:MAG: hypothetical protein ACD_54C01167G0001 [uncultured bacterium]|nr:MAG: hypothetical protein ACD_54C01167G0001 [uncultured bacterium]